MDSGTKIWKFRNVKAESADGQKKRSRIILTLCVEMCVCDLECLLCVCDVVCVCV